MNTQPVEPAPPLHYALARCSLGALLVARSPLGLCALALGDQPEGLREALLRHRPLARPLALSPEVARFLDCVQACVEAPAQPWPDELPLDLCGTPFQQAVWTQLRAIPPGQTLSYTALASRLGRPRAVRAVAAACAANPVAVAVPCHRVLRQDGRLAGYRWGLARKQALLAREATGLPHAATL